MSEKMSNQAHQKRHTTHTGNGQQKMPFLLSSKPCFSTKSKKALLFNWILDFLTRHSQCVRDGGQISSTLVINTRAPLGCMLYHYSTRFTHKHPSYFALILYLCTRASGLSPFRVQQQSLFNINWLNGQVNSWNNGFEEETCVFLCIGHLIKSETHSLVV